MPAEHLHAVSHLTTALTGPLQQIETQLLTEQACIETWLRTEWRKTPAPHYTLVDLRIAGFKLSPVNTNLFPAGVNNLNSAFLPLYVLAMQSKNEQLCEITSNILPIPEDHNRNLFYLERLATLRNFILKAGCQVRIGSLRPDLKAPEQVALPSRRYVRLEPLIKRGRYVGVADYDACLVILNNDLTCGAPDQFHYIEQHVVPQNPTVSMPAACSPAWRYQPPHATGRTQLRE